MQISLLGNSTFKIKGKKLSLMAGFLDKSSSSTEAKIVIAPGQEGKNYLKKITGEPFIITAPGEYEISGVSVFGIDGIYVIEMEEIRICYLEKLDSNLTDEQLEEVDGVDILLIPVDREEAEINQALNIISQIQPKILIPFPGPLLKPLLKELNQEQVTPVKKLTVSKGSLPEEMEIVILKNKANGKD